MLRSGNTNTVACPATGLSGAFFSATSRSDAASYWSGPSISRSGRLLWRGLCLTDFFDVGAGAGLTGAVTDERDFGRNAEVARGLGALYRDIGEAVGVWVWIDCAVAIDEDLIGQAHEKDGGNDLGFGRGFNELKRGADGVGRGVDGAGDEAIDFVECEHDGAEHDGVFECVASVAFAEVFVLAHLHEGRDVALGDFLGIDDLDAGEVGVSKLGDAAHFLGLPSSTQRARPRFWQMAAASMVRGSSPSGRMMRLLALACTPRDLVAERCG